MKREKLLKEVWIVNGGKDLGIQDEENIQHFTTSVFRFVNSLFLSGFFFLSEQQKRAGELKIVEVCLFFL